MKRILITGGGSGGHAMPAIAIIEALKKEAQTTGEELKILYVGSHKGIEKKIAEKNQIDFVSISTGKLRRYLSLENFLDLFRILKGIFDSFQIIRQFKPTLIFSTGGFVSVPVVIAGRLKKVKIIIHEQTVDAGLANKIAARFADKIALTFKESGQFFPSEKVEVTGIPLRDSIFHVDKTAAKIKIGITSDAPVIYISGGGLGCHKLNLISKEILPKLLEKTNVILQTGNANNGQDYLDLLRFRENIEKEEQKKRLFIYNFIEDVGSIYAVTDLVVSRSGAGTVNELIALKIPAVFIPLAIATNDEQLKNASIMQKIGAAEIVKEKDLNAEHLYFMIEELIFTEKLANMKANLQAITNFRGNDNLLELIRTLSADSPKIGKK